MVRISQEAYPVIYRALNSPDDIKTLARRWELPEEVLKIIYTHKVIRRATARYRMVSRRAEEIASQWERGESILSLSEKHAYPPALMAMMVLQSRGYSRRGAWIALRETNRISDHRLRAEVEEAVSADMVYSPWASEEHHRRGREVESRIARALDSAGLSYLREAEIREFGRKTPDFLLTTPLYVRGMALRWVEVKASFCDEEEMRKVSRRQLIPYTEAYGPGAVIYWYGYLEGLSPPKKVLLLDAEDFTSLLERLSAQPPSQIPSSL